MSARALILALLLCASLSLAAPGGRATAAAVVGASAPAFVASTVAGETFDLAKLRGKVVLIHYWATWCEPCRHEMPLLDALYRRYHDHGLEIVAISIDRGSDIETARKMAASFAYPTVVAPGIATDSFGRASGVPLTYVVGPDGVVRDKFNETTDKLVQDVVIPMLSK